MKYAFKTTSPQMKLLQIKTPERKLIEFKNSSLETFSEETAEFVRNHPHFKNGNIVELPPVEAEESLVKEEAEAEEKDETSTDEPANAPVEGLIGGVTSKSKAIVYLVTNHAAVADDFKGKNVEEIKALALEKYGVTFASWE